MNPRPLAPRYLVNFDFARLPGVRCHTLIVGTGIAGLYTALKAKDSGPVIVLTKKKVEDSNTEFAQGGIAAAIGHEDSPRLHMADTLEAGAGLCDLDAVRILVTEGPECVMELVALGTQFDRSGDDFALTREGAHSERRILHARGDATGDEIRRALSARVAREPGIRVLENHYLAELLTHRGRCIGVLAFDESGHMTTYLAPNTILATGGAGQLYRNSTNPEVATGDGIAVAYRAGAEISDVEFVQFHPTALYHEGSPKFLISEAVRGEGALLLNKNGLRFMPAYHPRAELAPRDVVARAIVDQMARTGASFVYLDARGLGPEKVRSRFPTIYAKCLGHGIDMASDPIPVAPAAHYIMGGIRTDADGRTNLPGLYSCGETAATGIHGANRLASNSLLEGLVFGKRIARAIAAEGPAPAGQSLLAGFDTGDEGTVNDLAVYREGSPAGLDIAAAWSQVQNIMWDQAGLVRTAGGLREAVTSLEELSRKLEGPLSSPTELQLANLVTVGLLIARAALQRQESRGGHYRADFPQRDDLRWKKHLVQSRGRDLNEHDA